MTEATMWTHLKPLLSGLDPMRIENRIGEGTPDVECMLGWIELKQIAKLPDDDAMLLVPKFMPWQRAWLLSRSVRVGNCWVMICCGTTWMLFDGEWAATSLGRTSSRAAQDNAIAIWLGVPDQRTLRIALQSTYLPPPVVQ